jgi:hypothetical protein
MYVCVYTRTYTGIQAVTDASREVRFDLPDGTYHSLPIRHLATDPQHWRRCCRPFLTGRSFRGIFKVRKILLTWYRFFSQGIA